MMQTKHFGTSHVPFPPGVRAGDFVFVSGRVPVESDGKVLEGDGLWRAGEEYADTVSFPPSRRVSAITCCVVAGMAASSAA